MEACSKITLDNNNKGPSINHVSSEGEGGGPPKKPLKGDENRYLVLGKVDVVFEVPKIGILF